MTIHTGFFGSIDTHACVAQLYECGAATIPNFLSAELRARMLLDLCFAKWVERKGAIGKSGAEVYGDYVQTKEFSGAPAITSIAAAAGCVLEATFNSASPALFQEPLRFNEWVAQRYEAGSRGITAHRDEKKSTHLVAVLVLEGHGRFCVSDDRQGTNTRVVQNKPGDLVLLRAPGFAGQDMRPFHFVDQILTRRMTLGLRHVVS